MWLHTPYRLAVADLRQLRTFVAVAEELNFTRAAERLSVAQQAVSRMIGQLEGELGVRLVERTTREVRLTAAGEALLAAGRPALRAIESAFESARETGRGRAGAVRIGCSPAIGSSDRWEAIRALRHDAPEVSVSVHEIRPGEIARRLGDRELDLVLARTAPATAELESVTLRPTPVGLCVPSGHRLAGESSVALHELNGERLLVWSSPGTAFTDLLLSRTAAAGAVVEPVEAKVLGGGALLELAALDAVALMPVGQPEEPGIVQLPLTDDVTWPLLLVWRVGTVPATVRRLREAMISG